VSTGFTKRPSRLSKAAVCAQADTKDPIHLEGTADPALPTLDAGQFVHISANHHLG
jgi:hypothetical protein